MLMILFLIPVNTNWVIITGKYRFLSDLTLGLFNFIALIKTKTIMINIDKTYHYLDCFICLICQMIIT